MAFFNLIKLDNEFKKFWYVFILAILCISFDLNAQTPCFESVKNSSVCLDELKKPTIFIFISQLSDQKAAETWLNPLYNKLIVKADMLDSFIDADVVVFSTSASLNTQIQLKKKTIVDWLNEWKINHLLYCNNEADLTTWKSQWGINYNKAPGIAVYNPKNKSMKFITESVFSDDKMDLLEDFLLEN